MSASFDPYHAWLGIPAADQPPHHYRLLGLQVFESDTKVVDHAADRIMYHLRTLTNGPNGPLSQKLLNEVATARATLVDPALRGPYDQQLRTKLRSTAQPAPEIRYQPVMVPVPVPVHYPVQPAMPPLPAPPLPGYDPGTGMYGGGYPSATPEPAPAAAPILFSGGSTAVRSAGRRRASDGGIPHAVIKLVKLIVGGAGGLAIGILIIWFVARSDPFGLFDPVPTKTVAKGPKQAKPAIAPQPSPATPAPTVPSATTPQTPGTNPAGPATTTTPETPSTTPETSTATPEPMPLPAAPVDPKPVAPLPASDARRPTPTNEQQQAKLAELKAVYKTEFESGAKPAGREAFTQFVIDTADRLKSDPVARFVLLREGFNGLMKAKDYSTAAEIVDRFDREFAMDPYKLRLHVLKEASASAKLQAERLTIAQCAMELVEVAIRQQRMTEANELVRIAESQARTLSDPQFKAKVTAAKLEVDKLADQWGPVERARKTLAANPADPEASYVDGKYRCLVDGSWSLGIPLLAQGKDQQLAAAARQDVAGPNGQITAAILGDNWFEIARSHVDLVGFYARARHWYKQAAAQVEGLDKVRLEQRIEQVEAMNLPSRLLEELPPAAVGDTSLPPFYAMFTRTQSSAPIDLFKFSNVQQAVAGGTWSVSGTPDSPRVSSNASTQYARIASIFQLPREYQVRIDVHRPSSDLPASEAITGPFIVGLIGPKGPFLVAIDMPVSGSFASFLNLADAKSIDDNQTARKLGSPLVLVPPRQFGGFAGQPPRSATILCQVRRRSVVVTVDGIEACRLEGDLSQLSLPKEWAAADNRALIVGSNQCRLHIDRWTIESLPSEALPVLSPPPGLAPAPPQS